MGTGRKKWIDNVARRLKPIRISCLSFRSDTRREKMSRGRVAAAPLHFFTSAEADDPSLVSSYHCLCGTASLFNVSFTCLTVNHPLSPSRFYFPSMLLVCYSLGAYSPSPLA